MEENKNKILLALILGTVIIFAAVGAYLVFTKINEDDRVEKTSDLSRKEEFVLL